MRPGKTTEIYWSEVMIFAPIQVAIVVAIRVPVLCAKIEHDLPGVEEALSSPSHPQTPLHIIPAKLLRALNSSRLWSLNYRECHFHYLE